jgi:hypothetical protein
MKKFYFLVSIASFMSFSSFAQISKGSIWLGGNIGFSNSKNANGENSKSDYYSISPSIGVAVKENTILGIELNFDRSNFKSELNSVEISHYGIAAFERKYWEILNRFYAFGHFQLAYAKEKRNNDYTNATEKSNGWSASLSAAPGLAFAIGKRCHLETMLNDLFYVNYGESKNNTTNVSGITSYDSHSISGGINFEGASTITLGVRFLVGK